MAITHNGTNISNINYNSTVINTVTYNGATVFSRMVEYTFPNSNAKMTSETSIGMKVYYDSRNGYAGQSGYCAFDNDLATAFVGNYYNGGKQLGITFPFPIYIQSIIIKNVSSNPASSKADIGGLKTGTIYISSTEKTQPFTGTVYSTLSRANASTASYATTHTNSSYNSTSVRSICIIGDSWGSSGTQPWHVIGEVIFNFKVSAADLISWKSTYGIS